MNPRRQTTVHDVAALRVHRDGSRVLNSDTNLSSRRAKYATHDARGNWIAHDAGGLGTVKPRLSGSQPVSGEGDDGDEGEGSRPSGNWEKGKGRAKDMGNEHGDLVALNPRAQKRKRFDEDMSYLDFASSPPASTPPLDAGSLASLDTGLHPNRSPVPSSDLLKCLHYIASTYYSAMGQLYDATKDFRQQRKKRKAQKLQDDPGSSSSSASSEEAINIDDAHDGSDEDVLHDDPVEEREGRSHKDEGKGKGKGKRRKPKELRAMEKDMYKLFDGSALMALGMLLQEHVAELLEPKIPEGWEKEIAVVEQERRAEARRNRQAARMKEKRHPGKGKGSELGDDLESEDEGDAEYTRAREGKVGSEDTEEDDGGCARDSEMRRSRQSAKMSDHSSVHLSSDSGSDE